MFAENRRVLSWAGVILLAACVSPVVAAPEACCFNPTGCLNLEPGDCVTAGGFGQGPGTNCTGVDCSSSGSCCAAGGGCSNGLSNFICTDSGGTYHGNGTSCQGAESTCNDGIDNDCDGNVDCADADCTSSPACLGACCNADGTCDNGMSAATCTGAYQGNGTNCGSVICPEALGACCLTGGSCLELTLDDCTVVPNSGWAGAFTTCGGSFPAEATQTLCCDGYDNDCDGFTDSNDADCVGFACANPPAFAPFPHDRRKNRYISFTPNNGNSAVAFRVQKTTAPTGSCWVQTPITALGNNQFTATCGANPVFRVWNEPVIHVGDCEIIPVANYEIFTNLPGPLENATPLAVGTILPPVGNKLWGDNVGSNNGIEWTQPNQIVSVNDITSLLAFISGSAIKPHFTVVNLQAISSADPCLNAQVGSADVLIAVRAVSGDSYGPPATTKITDPAQCALPPSANCPCCGN